MAGNAVEDVIERNFRIIGTACVAANDKLLSIEMTARYTNLSVEYKRNAVGAQQKAEETAEENVLRFASR